MQNTIMIFIKYCVVGGSGAILSWIMFYIFTRKLKIKDYMSIKIYGRNIQLPWAIALTTVIAVIWNFTWNLLWTFN